ncbi:MAG: rhodanese-like domain-containing protein [Planctomycetes bacterium]|nr:rhodanese-like domain-containing protein [Planctomycetota bacterium]
MGLFSKWFGGARDAKPPETLQSNPAPEPEPAVPEVPPWKELTPAESRERIEAGGIVVLDVRTPREFESRRIDGARLIPVQQLTQRIGELDRDAIYLVHCEHGMRSADACYYLSMTGFKNIYEMAGGIAQYTGPTVRGPVQS